MKKIQVSAVRIFLDYDNTRYYITFKDSGKKGVKLLSSYMIESGSIQLAKGNTFKNNSKTTAIFLLKQYLSAYK